MLKESTISYLEEEMKFIPTLQIGDARGTSISDLHIPFLKEHLLDQVLSDSKKDGYTDFCIVNGDFLDIEAISTYAKNRVSSLKREYEEGLRVLAKIAETFDTVIVTQGNHEDRIKNKLMKQEDFLKLSFMFRPDMMLYLTEGYKYDEDGLPYQALDFSNVYYFGTREFQLGDVIFGHPNTYSKKQLTPPAKGVEYFIQYTDNFSAFVMGHTHRIAFGTHLGRYIFETGCLSMDNLPKNNYNRVKPQNGYLRIEFQDGKIDINHSTLIHL